jgi:hypothetical protein
MQKPAGAFVPDEARFSGSRSTMEDLHSHRLDPRLAQALMLLAQSHGLGLGLIKTGHPMGPLSPSDRVNSHYYFGAADIVSVDGYSVARRPLAEEISHVGQLILSWPRQPSPDEAMGPAEWHRSLGGGGMTGFRDDEHANAIHADHLHIGYKPTDAPATEG